MGPCGGSDDREQSNWELPSSPDSELGRVFVEPLASRQIAKSSCGGLRLR